MRQRDGSNYDIVNAWLAIPPPPDVIHEKGACVGADQDLFFLEVPSRTKDEAAKAYCERCPVVDDCFNYAIRLPWSVDFGVWGNTNRNERKDIRDGRKQHPRRPGRLPHR